MSSRSQKTPFAYRRVLLKVGGDAFGAPGAGGVDPEAVDGTAARLAGLHELGVELAVVIGGGNIVRGAAFAGGGVGRVTSDAMGMLATVINALAVARALSARGVEARVLTPFALGGFTERFAATAARRHLNDRRLLLLGGGTGHPFFTTDTTAALRAAEVGAGLLVKATKVDGVYADDPLANPAAERYTSLTYRDVIERRLEVMDITAVTLCMENDVPVVVCSFREPGAVEAVLRGDRETGTWIGGQA